MSSIPTIPSIQSIRAPLRGSGTTGATSVASSLSRKPVIAAAGTADLAAAHSAAAEENDDDELEDMGEPVDVSEVCYRTGTADGDQLNMLLHAASGQCKEKFRTQLWNAFFSIMCGVICSNIIVNEPKGREADLWLKAYIMFVGFDNDSYGALLQSGLGLFSGCVGPPTMPEFVVTQSRKFISCSPKKAKKKSNETASPSDADNAVRMEKGREIWNEFKKTRAYVVNVANLFVRDIRSGENKTGLLLEIREKLWLLDQHRKRALRLKKYVTDKVGKGKVNFIDILGFLYFHCLIMLHVQSFR